jgi:hypothetical protein
LLAVMSSPPLNRPASISVFSDQRRTKSTIWSRVSQKRIARLEWKIPTNDKVLAELMPEHVA